jgi:hypothetical protein
VGGDVVKEEAIEPRVTLVFFTSAPRSDNHWNEIPVLGVLTLLGMAGVQTVTDLMRTEVMRQGNVVLVTPEPELMRTSWLRRHARETETAEAEATVPIQTRVLWAVGWELMTAGLTLAVLGVDDRPRFLETLPEKRLVLRIFLRDGAMLEILSNKDLTDSNRDVGNVGTKRELCTSRS